MRILALQLDIVWEDKEANHAKVRRLLDSARPRDALIVLPEMFATGFSMNVREIAEAPATGPTHRFLASIAKDYGINVLAGVVTKAPGDLGRNEAVLFAPDGREAARYQKIHPFCIGGEKECYEAGRAPLVRKGTWGDLTLSPFLCYDLRFPEIFRAATRRGAEVFAVIANWPVARIQHWVTLLQARAIENQAYVIGVNRVGTDPKLTYTGRSLIVGPGGSIIADAGETEGTISADLDAQTLRKYRQDLPFLTDIRDDYVRPAAAD